jgi:hypothetical protein
MLRGGGVDEVFGHGYAVVDCNLQRVFAETYAATHARGIKSYETHLANYVRDHADKIDLIKQFYREAPFMSSRCKGCGWHCGSGVLTLTCKCEMRDYCALCRIPRLEAKDKLDERVRQLATRPVCPTCAK